MTTIPDHTHQPADTDWLTFLTDDARNLTLVPDQSIDCIVTSPPYNVGIPNYPSGTDDHIPWPDYAEFAGRCAATMFRVAKPTARLWLNVQPTVPHTPGTPEDGRVNLLQLWLNAITAAGWIYRDTVAWVQDSFDGGCAWGSYGMPSAPNLRGDWESIIVAYRDNWKRPVPNSMKSRKVTVRLADGTKKIKSVPGWKDPRSSKHHDGYDWDKLTRNVWKIRPAHRGLTHGIVVGSSFPAAFPLELAERAIRLSTWPGQTVLDPFAGSATTGLAAANVEGGPRHAVLVDLGWPAPEQLAETMTVAESLQIQQADELKRNRRKKPRRGQSS